MKSGYSFFRMYHIDTVRRVVNNSPPDATMFSADSIQIDIYWKFENEYLYHSGTLSKDQWFNSRYKNFNEAYLNGVRNIYDLNELKKLLEEHDNKV